MIIVGYDPVERSVFANVEGEPPAYHVPAAGLVAMHFREDGILHLVLKAQAAELMFFDPEGHPAAIAVTAIGLGRWAIAAC